MCQFIFAYSKMPIYISFIFITHPPNFHLRMWWRKALSCLHNLHFFFFKCWLLQTIYRKQMIVFPPFVALFSTLWSRFTSSPSFSFRWNCLLMAKCVCVCVLLLYAKIESIRWEIWCICPLNRFKFFWAKKMLLYREEEGKVGANLNPCIC